MTPRATFRRLAPETFEEESNAMLGGLVVRAPLTPGLVTWIERAAAAGNVSPERYLQHLIVERVEALDPHNRWTHPPQERVVLRHCSPPARILREIVNR